MSLPGCGALTRSAPALCAESCTWAPDLCRPWPGKDQRYATRKCADTAAHDADYSTQTRGPHTHRHAPLRRSPCLLLCWPSAPVRGRATYVSRSWTRLIVAP
eukprot:10446387-Lingulodinium_polyedra.AAC.1